MSVGEKDVAEGSKLTLMPVEVISAVARDDVDVEDSVSLN
jgi:hypothetical protein